MELKTNADFIKIFRDVPIAWVAVDASFDDNASISVQVPITDLSLNSDQMAAEAKKKAAEYVAALADVLKVDSEI